jgi:hypothetical protein
MMKHTMKLAMVAVVVAASGAFAASVNDIPNTTSFLYGKANGVPAGLGAVTPTYTYNVEDVLANGQNAMTGDGWYNSEGNSPIYATDFTDTVIGDPSATDYNYDGRYLNNGGGGWWNRRDNDSTFSYDLTDPSIEWVEIDAIMYVNQYDYNVFGFSSGNAGDGGANSTQFGIAGNGHFVFMERGGDWISMGYAPHTVALGAIEMQIDVDVVNRRVRMQVFGEGTNDSDWASNYINGAWNGGSTPSPYWIYEDKAQNAIDVGPFVGIDINNILNGNSITTLAQPGSGLAALQITGYGVPEPATMALLGLGGLALIRRRRSA